MLRPHPASSQIVSHASASAWDARGGRTRWTHARSRSRARPLPRLRIDRQRREFTLREVEPPPIGRLRVADVLRLAPGPRHGDPPGLARREPAGAKDVGAHRPAALLL